MKRILAAAALAAMLAGCGGGGGGHAAIPSTPSGSTGSGAGSGSGSGVPVSGNSKGTATVVAKASLTTSAIPQMYDRKTAVSRRSTAAKLKAMGTAVSNVEVDGTLYQGSAAAVPVTNTQTVPVTNGAITVSETFSNVVPANNDWVVFEFYAVAADGSKTQLGSLGTFVNVGASTTTTNLGTASTQVLEVAAEMMYNGQISTYDIEQNATLASALATQIAGFNPPVDAQTGLYDETTVATLATELASDYERDITVNAANAAEISVVYDSTKADENDLAYNAATFATAFQLVPNVQAYVPNPSAEAGTTIVLGAPLTSFETCCPGSLQVNKPVVPVSGPSSGLIDAQPTSVYAVLFPTATGSVTLRNVYGGHIILGAHNSVFSIYSTLPATSVNRQSSAAKRSPTDVTNDSYGANATLGGEAAGTTSQTLTLADTLQTTQISDPAIVAFSSSYGRLANEYYNFAVAAGPNAAGTIPSYNVTCPNGSCPVDGVIDAGTEGIIGMPSSSGVSTLTFDAWSPFNIPLAQLELCGFNQCAVPSPTATIDLSGTFDDPITNPAVYSWTASGAATSIVQDPNPPCCQGNGYLVTYTIPANNTGPLTLTLSGTAPASFKQSVPARPTFYVYSNSYVYGDPFTISFTDTNNTTYSDSGPLGNTLPLSDVAAPFLVKSFTFTLTLPASQVQNSSNSPTTGTFDIQTFEINGTYQIGQCDC